MFGYPSNKLERDNNTCEVLALQDNEWGTRRPLTRKSREYCRFKKKWGRRLRQAWRKTTPKLLFSFFTFYIRILAPIENY